MTSEAPKVKNENAFLNILFNVIIPVVILNKGSDHLGAVNALFLALFFPVSYGVYDLWKRRKVNALSILGLLNVSVTGGLAIYGIEGIWFAVKEAVFPLIIAAFVAGSAFTRKPFIQTLIMNPQTMKLDLIEDRLRETGRELDFLQLLQRATWLLSLSFLVSAILNFWLAQRIFTPLDPLFNEAERARVLNEQIGQMTGLSFVVIMIPSMIMLIGIMAYLFRGMTRTTGLSLQDLIR